MSVIKIKCINQALYFEHTPVIASGDKGVDFVEFSFCSKWDGYQRVAVFWRTEEEVYHVNLDASDTCAIPREVMTQEGVLYLGAFGVNDAGQRRTTQVLTYRIEKGAIVAGGVAPDPSPSIYDQLLALYTEMNEKYIDVTETMTYKADLVDGKVPASQLPGFVDDVLEYSSKSAFPATGESGKLYVAMDTNLTHRWGGSTYVEVSSSLALGVSPNTAFRGDWGLSAYTHSQSTGSNPHGTTAEQTGAVPDTRTVNGYRLNRDIRLPIITASEEEPEGAKDGDVWLDLSEDGVDDGTGTGGVDTVSGVDLLTGEETDVLERQELTFTVDEDAGTGTAATADELVFKSFGPYYVEWDGAEYYFDHVEYSTKSMTDAFGNIVKNETVCSLTQDGVFSIVYKVDNLTGEVTSTITAFASTATTHTVRIFASTAKIKERFLPETPVATAVDFTAFDNDGVITETLSDGSTVTYTMEFDSNGNPTKITDSSGNVTTLSW